MKLLSSVFLLTVVQLASSKISNAVPSFSKAHNSNHGVSQVRPVRDAPYRIGEPVYMNIDELQRQSSASDFFPQQLQAYGRDADARSCCLKKKEPIHVQPVYYPVHQEYQQIVVPHTEYEQISVPHTEYHQITVPHTEYQHVTVPVQQPCQSYQSYPVYQSYSYSGKKGCFKSADETADYPTYQKSAELAAPALQDSALYKAIAKPLVSAYDSDINRNFAYPADAYQGFAPAEVAYSPYQAKAQAQYPDGRAAYAQTYQAQAIPEMRAAIATDMQAADFGRNAQYQAADFGRNAQYQTADFGRNAQYQAADLVRNAQYQADGRSAQVLADMNQRAAIAPEQSRAAYADFNQRAAFAPEQSRAAYADFNQRAAFAPEQSRAAYADFNQRAAFAPEQSYAGPWMRASTPDFTQRAAAAPEWWNRNAMYQADGRAAYAADAYQRSAAAYPEAYQRNAVAPEVAQYKATVMDKAPLAEGKPAPAKGPLKQSAPESAPKGKSESH